MRQDDSGSALQRIRRLLVQVRDGTRVFENFVTHDKLWVGRRRRLDSEDMGTTSGKLPAGRTREVGVQKGAHFLRVVSLPRAIGLVPTNGHDGALRALPHRARAAFRALSRRSSGVIRSAASLAPFPAAALPPSRPSATAWGFLRFAIAGDCTASSDAPTVLDIPIPP
jgi:hypothetical protein